MLRAPCDIPNMLRPLWACKLNVMPITRKHKFPINSIHNKTYSHKLFMKQKPRKAFKLLIERKCIEIADS